MARTHESAFSTGSSLAQELSLLLPTVIYAQTFYTAPPGLLDGAQCPPATYVLVFFFPPSKEFCSVSVICRFTVLFVIVLASDHF